VSSCLFLKLTSFTWRLCLLSFNTYLHMYIHTHTHTYLQKYVNEVTLYQQQTVTHIPATKHTHIHKYYSTLLDATLNVRTCTYYKQFLHRLVTIPLWCADRNLTMLQVHITKTHSETEDKTLIYNSAWCKINKYSEKHMKIKHIKDLCKHTSTLDILSPTI